MSASDPFPRRSQGRGRRPEFREQFTLAAHDVTDHPHDHNGAYPLGTLGYAEVTANQTGISTEEDLTGLSVTVDVAANRYVRVTGAGFLVWTSDLGVPTGRIRESTVQRGIWARHRWAESSAGDNAAWMQGSVVLTPSEGSHTWRLTLAVSDGTVDLEAGTGQAAWILAEDIGSV